MNEFSPDRIIIAFDNSTIIPFETHLVFFYTKKTAFSFLFKDRNLE
jgi:hypothetical protein